MENHRYPIDGIWGDGRQSLIREREAGGRTPALKTVVATFSTSLECVPDTLRSDVCVVSGVVFFLVSFEIDQRKNSTTPSSASKDDYLRALLDCMIPEGLCTYRSVTARKWGKNEIAFLFR